MTLSPQGDPRLLSSAARHHATGLAFLNSTANRVRVHAPQWPVVREELSQDEYWVVLDSAPSDELRGHPAGPCRPPRSSAAHEVLGVRIWSGYISATTFRTARSAMNPGEKTMILTREEAERLLDPHHRALLECHEDGYKERRRTMVTIGGQWALQDGTTQGSWTRNLILGEARRAEAADRRVVRDGPLDLVDIFDEEGRLAARLRLRRVELYTPWADDGPRPRLPAASSDTAEDWFGNRHLFEAFQPSLIDDDADVRLPTHLLVGRAEDSVVGEFEHLYVVCYIGSQMQWFYEVESAADVVRNVDPLAPVGDLPSGPTIRRKARDTDIQQKDQGS